MKINIIFATNEVGAFGLEGSLAWHFQEDLRYFKSITTDVKDTTKFNYMIMGRKTFETFPKITDRKIIVVTKTEIIPRENVSVAESLSHALAIIKRNSDYSRVFVIGGKSLIEEASQYPKVKVYHTIVKGFFDYDVLIDLSVFDRYNKKKVSSKKLINTKDLEVYKLDYFIYTRKHQEYQYLDILKELIDKQCVRETRNARTISSFGKTIEFDLQQGFPLLTTKKMFLRGIFEELMFFLHGQTNTKILENKNVNIWKGNTSKEFLESVGLHYPEGDMGPMYGYQWRHFNADYLSCEHDYTDQGIDQLKEVMDLLVEDPNSRRIIMTTFNPSQVKQGCLYPCHSLVLQFYVEHLDKPKVSVQMYQRSADVFLGLPFNIASTSLLLHLIVKTINKKYDLNYEPYKVILNLGDYHLYESHIEVATQQISRDPLRFPNLHINEKENIEDYCWEDIYLEGYQSHSKLEVSMIA